MKRSLLFSLFLIGIPFRSLFSQSTSIENNIDAASFILKEAIHSDTIFCFGKDSNASPKEYGDEILKIAEEMPRFPGCEDMAGTPAEKQGCANMKLLTFISKNLQYPENGACVAGRCYLSFIVEKDGRISTIKLLRDLGGGAGAAAIEVVEEMFCQGITWIPGKQRGKNVRVQFNLPIRFCL